MKEKLKKGKKMKEKTVTRADIAEVIYQELGFSHTEAFKLIDQVLETIIETLQKGEVVKIANFATFIPYVKMERIGRNPKTKKQYKISKRNVISFKASNVFKKTLRSEG